MTKAYFIDSSALIKRYVFEKGTSWIQEITDPLKGNLLIISRITWQEISHALTFFRENGRIASQEIEQIKHAFDYHLNTQYNVVEIDQSLAELEVDRISCNPLKGNGSIVVASVCRIQNAFVHTPDIPLIFVSADKHLLAIAKKIGLEVENPNCYP